MLALQNEPNPAPARALVPPLESGDRLHAREFLRRYERMPHVKKAELVKGVVFMASPVRIDLHADQDGLIHTWLGCYAVHTPGLKFYPNATLRLDSDNAFQPDAMLCRRPMPGGRTSVSEKGYLSGAPELVVEIAASSASIDARDKLDVYRGLGVSEYLLWRTVDKEFTWFHLEDEEYVNAQPDANGLLRSRVFPGLQLPLVALLALDGAKVMACLDEGLASPAHADFVRSLTTK
jgi:Uma2 family endonuclease